MIGQYFPSGGKDNWGRSETVSELHATRIYCQHNTDVLNNCPKGNLAVLASLDQTYEGFCRVLGIELPEKCRDLVWPFENKGSEMIKEMVEMTRPDSIISPVFEAGTFQEVFLGVRFYNCVL